LLLVEEKESAKYAQVPNSEWASMYYIIQRLGANSYLCFTSLLNCLNPMQYSMQE